MARSDSEDGDSPHASTRRHREEESDDVDEHHQRRPKKKKKKVRIMDKNEQTDAERRELRAKQRALQKTIQSSEVGDSIENPDSTAFDKVRKDNNTLWDNVRFTREAVLDGDNLELIATRAAKQCDKLVQVPAYDANKLAKKLRDKLTTRNGGFGWAKLGCEIGLLYNKCPSATFFNGPMDSDYTPKERKKPERRKRQADEEEEEEEAEDEEDKTSAADKLSAVEKHMVIIGKTLKKRTAQEKSTKLEEVNADSSLDERSKKKAIAKFEKEGICAVQGLFNPKSFTQTVENIFHFSFLVKKGDAGIMIAKESDGTKRPKIRTVENNGSHPPSRQSVISMNMADWREMCSTYNVKKGDIPHRTGSRHSRE